jgi:hypothetical protein
MRGTIEEQIARRGTVQERDSENNGEKLYSRAAIEVCVSLASSDCSKLINAET